MTEGGRVAGEDGRSDEIPLTAAERARAPRADFERSLEDLSRSVSAACRPGRRWEERVLAGISAVLEFARANPDKAHALTVAARREGGPEGGREARVIEHFTRLLEDGAPVAPGRPSFASECVTEAVATVVRGYLLSGRTESLPELAPDLVYMTLAPRLGIDAAREWADRAIRD